ncbi:hypothetical protein GS892_10420, partial [Rhodococcus hoagii]|nr:hypothetical protein [Prescottella equi]
MSTAEQIIAEHRDAGYLDGRRHCLCGWSTIDHDGIDPAAEHAAHVVAALTNADHVIVKLPRGSRTTTGRCGSTSSTSASTAPGQAGRTRLWVGGDHAPQLGSSIWAVRVAWLLLVWRRAV